MEIVLVDKHNLHTRPVKVFGKAQSAQSATNDYHSLLLIPLNIDAHNKIINVCHRLFPTTKEPLPTAATQSSQIIQTALCDYP